MAEFKHIVRIANTDVAGEKQIMYSLTKIKGVSIMFSHAVCKLAGVHEKAKTGELSDKEIEKLDSIIREPAKSGVPRWMLNRREDYETGEDMHLLGGDIKFVNDQDIKKMRKMKSYKGLRHAVGLTVRGQKTKSNFRNKKGKKSLGVKRKK